MEVQEYKKADVVIAEASFFRINQGGTPLDAYEREIIRTRRWPESIASRTLWRAGVQAQYKLPFREEVSEHLHTIAAEIYTLLLQPEIDKDQSPLQLPLIGTGTTNASMGTIDQFVHLANDLPDRLMPKDKFKAFSEFDTRNDTEGSITIEYLEKSKALAQAIASKEPESIGLHPGVYCYSKTGKFLEGAFFAEVRLVKDLMKHKEHCSRFLTHRKAFEQFLVDHKHHLSELTHDGGSKMKSAVPIYDYWMKILDSIADGKNPIDELEADSKYSSVAQSVDDSAQRKTSYKVSRSASLAHMLRQTLEKAWECPECGARIYQNAWTKDHLISGGSGHSDFLGAMQPCCNSGSKTRREHLAKKAESQRE